MIPLGGEAVMMALVRRWVVLAALMFWQGGFTFYASVVVPMGQEVLGSHRHQGFITQRVTNYLNLAGGIALIPLAWDVAVARDRKSRRQQGRWLTVFGMGLTLGLLVWLHPRLDELLDPGTQAIHYRQAFRRLHSAYLWISTVQWGCAVLYVVLTVWAWRAEDRALPQEE
jgi:hypothetical protein